jgi:uncharacterized membrane protein YfcA
MIDIIGYLLALTIGISLGLLGGGGSVLALPVLVYVMQVEPKSAIAMTLVIVGTVSFLGCLPHLLKGRIPLKIAVAFGTATTIGAYFGAKLANLPFVTSTFQMVLFGLAMLTAAALMIYRTSRSKNTSQDNLNEPQYIKPTCKYCWLWLMTEGIGVGILTGLVGVGGGFAIVPALVLLANIPMKQAIGTSLLIIACNAIAGLLGYLGQVPLDWSLTISFTFLAGCGTLIGSYLVQFVSAKHLQKGFGYFLLIIAAFVLVQNLAF